MFAATPSLRRTLTSQPGVVANIMEALEMPKMDVLVAVLRVINRVFTYTSYHTRGRPCR